MVIVGGPTRDYLQPAVDALKNYVENGGQGSDHAGTRLSSSPKENIDDNAGAGGRAGILGRPLADKDLVLDTSGVGQLYGLGPEIALVSTYGTQSYCRGDEEVGVGFSR